MTPKEEAHLRVRAYLEKNKKRLQVMNVDFIVWDVRTFVPGTDPLPDSELRATVAVWRSLNGPLIPLPTAAPPTISDSKLISSVKSAFTTVIEGVDLKHGDGKINISVTGVTAELKRGDRSASVGVSWGGTLGVEAKAGSFHFVGELSSERWELRLSYPEDTAIPDLSRLGQIFGSGEKAMREIIGATASFRNLHDAPRIKEAIKPHMKPVTDAVEAAKGIAKAKGGVNFGFSLGSPDPMPGETGIPRGVQGQVTLTIRF